MRPMIRGDLPPGYLIGAVSVRVVGIDAARGTVRLSFEVRDSLGVFLLALPEREVAAGDAYGMLDVGVPVGLNF